MPPRSFLKRKFGMCLWVSGIAGRSQIGGFDRPDDITHVRGKMLDNTTHPISEITRSSYAPYLYISIIAATLSMDG